MTKVSASKMTSAVSTNEQLFADFTRMPEKRPKLQLSETHRVNVFEGSLYV